MKKNLTRKLAVIAMAAAILSTNMIAHAAGSYTVKKGDYLKKIAQDVYGDVSKWESIYEANKNAIKNPNLIYEGQIFLLPDLADTQAVPVSEPSITAPIPAAEAPTAAVPANTTMSIEEATQILDNTNFMDFVDDTTLAFFDKNGDMTINSEEYAALAGWIVCANDTDMTNNTLDSPLSDAEIIAMASLIKEGKLATPSKLFNAAYADGLWLTY